MSYIVEIFESVLIVLLFDKKSKIEVFIEEVLEEENDFFNFFIIVLYK